MLKSIAQEIAENIARLVGYDIVITDAGGTVVGSSDPGRAVGTEYETGAAVARTGQTRRETADDARRNKGLKPGVTCPILDAEQNVAGAVTISGDPEKVRAFSQLVKSQVELFVRERFLARQFAERERGFRALVADIALFRSGINDPQALETRAALMGYDKSLSYAAIELDTSSRNDADGDYPERDRTLADIREVFGAAGDVSGSLAPRRYVVFHGATREGGFSETLFYGDLRARCSGLCERLKRRGLTVSVGVGSLQAGVSGLVTSYREAQVALSVGPRIFPRERVHVVTDYRVEEIMLSSEPRLLESMVRRELSPLFDRSDGEELQETIVAWCESGFSVVRAAELLHVHRTTVDYRLEKLENILGVRPRDFRDMSRYYWAVILRRGGKGETKTLKSRR